MLFLISGVATNKYVLPSGGMFELVSCPHMLAEVLIYVSLCIIMQFSSMRWLLVTTWVISNQVNIQNL